MNVERLLLVVVLVLQASVCAAEPLDAVEVVERVEASLHGQPLREIGKNRIVISEDRVRVEYGSVVHLYDAAQGLYSAVRTRSGEYVQIDAARLRGAGLVPPSATLGLAVDPSTGGPLVPRQVFRRVQKSDTRSTWETTAAGWDGTTARLILDEKSDASWAAMESVVFAVFANSSSPLRSWLSQVEGLPGYPVRVEESGPQGDRVTTVVSVRRVTVDSQDFSVPPGLRRVADPNRLSP